MGKNGLYCIHSRLVGAMNPCPCGYYGDPFRQCTCPASLVSRYQKRNSGPFIDRVDIFVEVPHIDYEKLADDRLGKKSEMVQARVKTARSRQQKRFEGARLTCNAEMTPSRGQGVLSGGGASPEPTQGSHETTLPFCPCLPPHP